MTVSRFTRVPEGIFAPSEDRAHSPEPEDSGLLWREVGEDDNREPCRCGGCRSHFSGVEKWNDSCTGKGSALLKQKYV